MKKCLVYAASLFLALFLILPQVTLAAEPGQAVLSKEGDHIAMQLALPEGSDEITSVKISYQISFLEGATGNEEVTVAFPEGSKSSVKEYRYDAKSGRLTLYISGTENLLSAGSIDLGDLSIQSDAPYGFTANVAVIKDSIQIVNALYSQDTVNLKEDSVFTYVTGNGGSADDGSDDQNGSGDGGNGGQGNLEDNDPGDQEEPNGNGSSDTDKDPNGSDSPQANDEDQPAKTGDENPIGKWAAVFGIAAAVLVVVILLLVFTAKKQKKR